MPSARLTSLPDGRMVLESPYDPGFVAGLKTRVPSGSREWDAGRKRWLLSPLYLDEVQTLCTQFSLSVIDERLEAQTAALLAQDSPYASMPDDLRTAFATLTLAPAAPLCVAEAAYRALARVFHPDNPETGNHETAQRLTDAMATIRSYLTPQDDIPF